MVPVIRVDMEVPLIGVYYVDAGVWGALKNVGRVTKAVVNGRSIEKQTAKDRLENAIKEALQHFDAYTVAGNLQAGLNPVMTQFQDFFRVYSVFNITPYNTMQPVHGWFDAETLEGMKDFLTASLGLISKFNTSKKDSPILSTLAINFDALATALGRVQHSNALPPNNVPGAGALPTRRSESMR
jgi:hypothetical protein